MYLIFMLGSSNMLCGVFSLAAAKQQEEYCEEERSLEDVSVAYDVNTN